MINFSVICLSRLESSRCSPSLIHFRQVHVWQAALSPQRELFSYYRYTTTVGHMPSDQWHCNKEVMLCFLSPCLSFIVLCSIFVLLPKSTSKEVTLSHRQRCFYVDNLCVSLCNRHCVDIYFNIFIIKYLHSSRSADLQLLPLEWRYFRSHYLARHDPPYSASDWLHPAH